MSVCIWPYVPSIAVWSSQQEPASPSSLLPANNQSVQTSANHILGSATQVTLTHNANSTTGGFAPPNVTLPVQQPFSSLTPPPNATVLLPRQTNSWVGGNDAKAELRHSPDVALVSPSLRHSSPKSWTSSSSFSSTSSGLHSSLNNQPFTNPTSPAHSSANVSYSLDKVHMSTIASGDLSPLEQCRLRTWPLRQWLYEHRHNPYPTKADKKMLSREANLRPDQVAMWFANTRRRIKKVGMQSWSGGAFNNSDFRPRTTTRSSSGYSAHRLGQTSDGASSDDDCVPSLASRESSSSDPLCGL